MSDDTVPFGKYKGRPVEDMLSDCRYMAWLESQPWFRERFAHLMRTGVDETQSTPEHNRLQALFLDSDYLDAFLTVSGFSKSELWEGYVERTGAKPELNVDFEERLQIGAGACDVVISAVVSSWWKTGVEIKPIVADDYPAVLRQMKNSRARYLFVGRYEGEGATPEQFVAIFAKSNIKVVFKSDVDAEAERIRKGRNA